MTVHFSEVAYSTCAVQSEDALGTGASDVPCSPEEMLVCFSAAPALATGQPRCLELK